MVRRLVLLALVVGSFGPALTHGASADGCNGELVVNEAVATADVGGDALTIRVWEDATCAPAGEGFGGPADQGHLEMTLGNDTVCSLDGFDMGNDPFGFGSSVRLSPDDEACGADIGWSGFPGVYGPDAGGPGVTKNAPAAGTAWWEVETEDGPETVTADVADTGATFSKRANAG